MRFPPTIRVGLLWGPLRFRTRSFLTRTGAFVAARRIPYAKENTPYEFQSVTENVDGLFIVTE